MDHGPHRQGCMTVGRWGGKPKWVQSDLAVRPQSDPERSEIRIRLTRPEHLMSGTGRGMCMMVYITNEGTPANLQNRYSSIGQSNT